ncbi:MAG: ABC transporter substrate-binding protein [Desulfovibrio sp.]
MLDPFRRIITVVFLIALLAVSATAALAETNKVRIASVGWTGVTIKTDVAVSLLNTLGYQAENILVSVPIAYKAMSIGEADAFLGNWMPSMAGVADKYFADGSVLKYVANMPGAKYTLATPTYCAEGGLKNFKDLEKYGEKLDWKIYGIEAGNDGNLIIQDMIDKDMFGLGKFALVSSSEAGMLAQVQSYTKDQQWIVFLGWAPHSMNEHIDMTYLDGSDANTFGENDGTATVWTNVRKDFAKDSPNAAALLKNMTFPVSMMNEIMTSMSENKKLSPEEAGLAWLRNHPETYKAWLRGITTADGKQALPVVESFFAN